MWKYRRKLTTFFLALLTLITTLIVPVFSANKVTGTEIEIKPTLVLTSQVSNTLNLEQQGKKYYDIGNFSEAAKIWQQAADAYGKDKEGKNKNLINKAKALQSLGLYPETCSQLLQVFNIVDLKCEQLKSSDKSIDNKIIEHLESQPNSLNKVIGLRLLGETLQKFGQLELSQQLLGITEIAAQQYPDQQSARFISLGNIERAIGNRERDKLEYKNILRILGDYKISDPLRQYTPNCIFFDSEFENISTTIDNAKIINKKHLEDYKSILKTYQSACHHYNEAKNQASLLTQTQAEVNQLSLLIEIQEWWNEQIPKSSDQKNSKSWEKFQKRVDYIQNDLNNNVKFLLFNLKSSLQKLPESREAVYIKINLAHSKIRFNLNINPNYSPEPEIAKILFTAIQEAHRLGDKQAESEAFTNLSRVYELQGLKTENLTLAKQFIEQALRLSNNINIDNRQILYRQRHQLGRILKNSGNIKGALISYAEAWKILQSLRADLLTSADNQFSFRQNVEPIYREFIDLLLQTESNTIDFKTMALLNNITGTENSLDIARLVMESLQLAELDNFFQDPCLPLVVKPVQINNIDPNAAIIYPIILKNRLEVILYRPNFPNPLLTHYHTDIKEEEVKNTLENLSSMIYNNTELESESALLINKSGIDESKLQENEKRIQKLSQQVYSWLIKPLEDKLSPNQTLVFVPDRPFQKISIAALYDGKNYLIQKYNIALNLGQQLTNPKPLTIENIKILAAGVSKNSNVPGIDFNELPGVENELNSIKNLGVPTEKILNKDFTYKNFQAKIESSPTIVHLATHGIFRSNREQTFILTGDGIIGIDDFQNLLNPQNKVSQKTIELLVLSACQTASGDDKAALGMAGVVLRSGASSTVASLWSVSDAATAELMKEFYTNLIKKTMTRAEALGSAQRSILNSQDPLYKQYKHPFYWAAFVLAGNWL